MIVTPHNRSEPETIGLSAPCGGGNFSLIVGMSINVPGPVNSAGRFGSKVKETKLLPGREKLAFTGAVTPKSRIVLLEAIEIPTGSFAIYWVKMAEFVTW